MVFMRAFFRGLVLLIVLISVALWVVAATLQMTVFNRDTVKSWAKDSGAYEHVIDTIEIRQVDATGLVNSDMLRRAIGAVVTPDYIQKYTEVAIDAAYNWIEGDAPQILYEIPIHEHRDDFIGHLGRFVEEKVRGLPQCSGSMSVNQECIPQAYTVETYALSVAGQTADDSDLFEEPITSEGVELVDTLKQLPLLATMSAVAMWLLPIVAVLGAAGYIALSRRWHKGMALLGKCLVFSPLALVVIGLLAWIFGGSLDIGARLFGGSNAAIVTTVVEPIIQQGIASIGMWLTLFAGSVVVVGAILWIVGYALQRRARGVINT